MIICASLECHLALSHSLLISAPPGVEAHHMLLGQVPSASFTASVCWLSSLAFVINYNLPHRSWVSGGKKCSFQLSRSPTRLKPWMRIFSSCVPACLILAQCTEFLFPPAFLYVTFPPSALTYYFVSNMNTWFFRSFSLLFLRLSIIWHWPIIENPCCAWWMTVVTKRADCWGVLWSSQQSHDSDRFLSCSKAELGCVQFWSLGSCLQLLLNSLFSHNY